MVTTVFALIQTESVQLDSGKLGDLYQELGDRTAEEILCRALEELGLRLSRAELHWHQGGRVALRKNVRSLIAISDQIGMAALVHVAKDVVDAIDANDHVAIGATVFRLLRIGEKSLTAVWDLQDMSI